MGETVVRVLNEMEDKCFDHDVQICNPHHGFVGWVCVFVV